MENDSPWRTLGSAVMYQNPWMKVREDKVLMPNGNQGIYGVVESKPGILVIALTENDKIHLIESFRYPMQKWQWELPAGGIEEGTSPLESAINELAEELGMNAKKWTHISTYGPSSGGFMNDSQDVFVAEGLSKNDSASSEEFEAIRAIKTATIQEVATMIKQGDLAGGQSLAALMHFFVWRGHI